MKNSLNKIKLVLILITLSLVLCGCTISRQKFIDRSYTDGLIEREIVGKKIIIAPPFGSRAVAAHSLDMFEDTDGWQINMGSNSNLEGGNITPEMMTQLMSLISGI